MQKNNLNLSEDEKAKAARAVARLIEKDKTCDFACSEDVVQRYCALRALRGPNSRITLKMLRGVVMKERYNQSLQKKYYIVPKIAKPKLDKEIDSDLMVDPRSLTTFPRNVKREEVWVCAWCVDKSKLGPSAYKWVTSVDTTIDYDGDEDAEEGLPALKESVNEEMETPMETGSAEESKRPSEESTSVETAAPKKRRLLSRAQTDTDAALRRELESAEAMAESVEQLALAGAWFSDNTEQYDTVDALLGVYVEHVSELHEEYKQRQSNEFAFLETLPTHLREYLSFVTGVLLDYPCFDAFKHMLPKYKKMRSICPELVPQVGKVLMKLAENSSAALELAGLPFDKKQTLINCKLYKHSVDLKALERFTDIKENKDARSALDRCQEARQLLQNSKQWSAERNEELNLAIMYLGKVSLKSRLEHLLDDKRRINVLREWSKDDECLPIEVFADANTNFKVVSADAFSKSAALVLSCSDFDYSKIPSAVVRQVLLDHKRMTLEAESDNSIILLANEIMMEAATLKLGLPRTSIKIWAFSQEQAKLASGFPKIFGGAWRKMVAVTNSVASQLNEALEESKKNDAQNMPGGVQDAAQPISTQQPVHPASFFRVPDPQPATSSSATPQPVVGVTEDAPLADSKDKTVDANVDAAVAKPKDEDGKLAETPAPGKSSQQGQLQSAHEPSFKVGDIVKLSVKQKMELYNGFKARIVKFKGIINLRPVVVLLEGPERNNEKDFPLWNVLPFTEEPIVATTKTDSASSQAVEDKGEKAELLEKKSATANDLFKKMAAKV